MKSSFRVISYFILLTIVTAFFSEVLWGRNAARLWPSDFRSHSTTGAGTGSSSDITFHPAIQTGADLAVTLSTSVTTVRAGDNLNYIISIKNNGPEAAVGVTLTSTLPAELTITSCPVCTGTGNSRTVTLGTLASGATATAKMLTRIGCSTGDNVSLSHLVTVTSSTADPVPANNTATSVLVTAATTNSLSPTTQSLSAAGGFGTVRVTSNSNCGWTAKSNDSSVTIADSGSGIGQGTVRYFVAANPTGQPRSGSLTIAGQTFSIEQAAGTISPVPIPTPAAFGPCPAPQFRGVTPAAVSGVLARMTTGDFNGDSFPDVAVTAQGAAQSPGNISILLNNGAGGFRAATAYTVGIAPQAAAVADFNGDGKPDLVVANRDSSNISVLIGKGDGTFGAATNFPTGDGPRYVAADDFNRDGKTDLAVVNGLSNSVSILAGNGNGSFGPAVNYPVGEFPVALAAADFNSDGKTDLVVAPFNSAFSVLLGDGNGAFTAGTEIPRLGVTLDLATGDFNGDGRADLALAQIYDVNAILVLAGDGQGGFGAPVLLDINNLPNGLPGYRTSPVVISVADFNADGRADLLTGNQDGTVSVIPGQGNLQFKPAISFASGSTPAGIVTEDFDGDGRLDVAADGSNPGSGVIVLFGDGAGRIGAPAVRALTRRLAVADFNRDGRLDLLGGDVLSRSYTVLLGDGRGAFAATRTSTAGIPGSGVESAAVGDFNGDGNPDFVIASGPNGGGPSIYLGDGTGKFTTSGTQAVSAFGVATGDLNGDGKIDIVTADREANSVGVLFNDGKGQFGTPVIYAGIDRPWSVVLADFNHDSRLDVAVTNQTDKTVSVLLNDGTGRLQAAVAYPAGQEPVFVTSSDFNGDDRPDLAVGCLAVDGVVVLLNDGTGKFNTQVKAIAGVRATAVTAADFNGDGKADLAVSDENLNRVVIVAGNGNGGFGTPVTYLTGSAPSSVATADFNGDGKPDLAVSNNSGSRPASPSVTGTVSILLNTCVAPGGLTSASAASYQTGRIGTESIVAAFGTGLASTTLDAVGLPLPTSLGGVSVKVKDSLGDERLAPLFYVSPTQINYQVPVGTETGTISVSVINGGKTASDGTIQLSPAAPGLFSADSSGQGLAAALILRVRADGSQQFEPVAVWDSTQGKYVARPIDPGPASELVFLVLFGTGIRGRSAAGTVTAQIGGTTVEVLYAGPQGGFVGLDQVNLPIPRTLAGRGEVVVGLTIDGKPANSIKINIK